MGNVIPIHAEKAEQEGGDNKIVVFFNCGLCFEELPAGMSMQEYSLNECGWTKEGFQVWCRRHNANIIHMDFEGQKHRTI